MFSYELDIELNYWLVSVCINGIIHCASYNKTDGDDEREVITCIESGEKFYGLHDFMRFHYGLRPYNIHHDFALYDEEEGMWMPLMMYIVRE